MTDPRPRTHANTVIGVLLIVAGAVALVLQFVDVELARFWPLFVIVPGVGLLAVGLALPAGPGRGLAIAGAITLTAGLVLAVQEATGRFETWAYLWALVAPGAVGAGLAAHALIHGNGRARAAGTRTLLIGLGLFVVSFVFFEGVIGLSGWDLGLVGDVLVPATIIAVGVAILLRGRRSGERAGD